MILRPATPADIPALSQLAIDSFLAKFGALYSQSDADSFIKEALSEPAIIDDLANSARLYRLAERNGALVGFCKLGLACDFPEHARGSNTVSLKQLYTDPAATGQGIGAQLMDWAIAECAAQGADEIQLTVYAENYGAHRFYARYGFDKVADITFKVGEQLDPEFLFAKRL